MLLSHIIKATIISLLFPISIYAQGVSGSSQSEQTEDIMELSLEENLLLPKVENKQHNAVAAYMKKQASELVKQKYKVESMRNGEVIIATINSDDLFSPNETVLSSGAGAYLHPFMKYLYTPDMYKVIIVMHSDDTGSEEYADKLTEERIYAVYEWFNQNNAEVSQLVPYAMGASEPLVPNDTRDNRKTNRRLEIYLVPGKKMIDFAKSGSLN